MTSCGLRSVSPERGLSKTRTCDEGWSGKPSDVIFTLRPEKPERKQPLEEKGFKALKRARILTKYTHDSCKPDPRGGRVGTWGV